MRSALVNTGLATLSWLTLSTYGIAVTPPLEDCSYNNDCCEASRGGHQSPHHLFSRGTCAVQCCSEHEKVISPHPFRVSLQCGKMGRMNSYVRTEMGYHPETKERAMHVYFEPMPQRKYYQVHLQLDRDDIKEHDPRHYQHNEFCQIKKGGEYAECYVPHKKMEELYGFEQDDDFCKIRTRMRMAAHAHTDDNDDCYGNGSYIDGKDKKRGMKFEYEFECEDHCKKSCCCPGSRDTRVAQRPNPQHKRCEAGIAYGFNPRYRPGHSDYTLREICNDRKRPGMYSAIHHKEVEKGYTQRLFVGSKNNDDISKGREVGSVRLSYNKGLKMQYSMHKPYQMDFPHVFISCNKPQHNKACNPAMYPIKPRACLKDNDRDGWSYTHPVRCETYYVIFHAAVTEERGEGKECRESKCRDDYDN